MFLRCNRRKKDGKVHEYWSVVENRRVGDGRVVQRQLLYLGQINASQHEAWRRSIEIEAGAAPCQVRLFAAEQLTPAEVDAIGVRLSQLRLEHPRQWGACWLALELWQQLELDRFWRPRLPPSREGTPWLKVLKTLVAYRLIDPGSEWRLHRLWFDASAMADLLESDFALASKDTLYRCLDRLVEHKDELFKFLVRRWGELFDASFEVLLYDLTSTYFETDELRGPQDLRQFGYSRDKRGDCRQVVIALIVTPQGFPLSYEVMRGNTADNSTLPGFLNRIEQRYGKAQRIWVMDRGIPTEDSLAKMRALGASYLVGTPKGRLTQLEQKFIDQPWSCARPGVKVKRLSVDEDVYVLAQSNARIDKERAMRRQRLRRYIKRLHALQAQGLTRDKLLMKLGAAKHDAGRIAAAVKVSIPKQTGSASFEFALDRAKLRQIRGREGRYLLRTNLRAEQPEQLWSMYVQLTEVEQAFKEIKHDLAIRPIFHQLESRIEAHIFVAFLAYCLQVTLKARLSPLASGLTPRQALDKFKTVQMVDVHIPTQDCRELVLSRYTQPETELRMLLQQLRLQLPAQPPPQIRSTQLSAATKTAEATTV
ncbi:MAG: IS1634 family transposase [Burkholderiaceae bacterium]|nr:IS1634 family transposase [Burkholderiaceae bacterium]